MSSPQPDKLDKSVNAGLSIRTFAARLTGLGRSAIAVIGITGPEAKSVIDLHFTAATKTDIEPGQIRYGTWTLPDRDVDGESIVVTKTNEDTWEVHCHGGIAAIERILGDISKQGVPTVSAETFTASQVPLLIAEAKSVLAQCITPMMAGIALDQARGTLHHWCESAIESLEATPPKLDDAALELVAQAAKDILESANQTVRLTDPFRVVLLGAPNVGKSSLVNAIVGYDRSITTPQAGTTRDVLHAETVIDGIPIRMSDTAGIRSSEDPIEQQGIIRAKSELASADLVLRVAQVSQSSPEAAFPDFRIPDVASIDLINKIDQVSSEQRESYQQRTPEIAFVSARTGLGIDSLMKRIARCLGEQIPAIGVPVVLNARQHNCVAEIANATDAVSMLHRLRSLRGDSVPVTGQE